MFDWQKNKKENTDVEPDKAVEQQHKAEQMYENLRRSGDGENFKVEEEKSVMGQRRRFNVTDKNGAKTDIDITESAQIEVRGEQKEIRNAIERGEKLSNVAQVQDGKSDVQKDVLLQINSSNLSETEKQQLRDNVEKHNFADTKQSNEQYAQDVQTAINTKENAKLSTTRKIQALRGISKENTKSSKSTNGRVISNSHQVMNLANKMTSPQSY